MKNMFKYGWKSAVFFIALFVMLFLYDGKDVKAAENGTFTVTDSESHVQNSYLASDNVNYVFLTNQNNLNAITLTSNTDIASIDRTDLTFDSSVDARTISGDFSSNATVTATMADGTTEVISLKQSDLPCMYITLNGTTLSEINSNKDVKHAGNSVTITDTDNASNNLDKSNVEMKGRGNTSWYSYDKKGYQIKFDKKTSVLGMGKAKKWVLLANSSDCSMMKNKIAFDVANQMNLAYTPDAEYVDLWVSGEYIGTYLVTEKVEIGSSRLNLTDPSAVLMEYDNDFYKSEENYFTDEVTGTHFVLKEAVTDGDLTGMYDFQNTLSEADKLMYSSRGNYSWDEISSKLDVTSFANWYVVNEYFLNAESASTSFYLYKDGASGKIAAGPVWDFDSSMGAGTDGSSDLYMYQHWLLTLLFDKSEFRTLVQQTYNQYKSILDSSNEEVDTLYTKLQNTADMNYTRWNRLGVTDPKGNDFPSTYSQAVSNLRTWLTARETGYKVYDPGYTFTTTVASDYRTTALTFKNSSQNLTRLWFVVWSNDNGTDDQTWYEATLGSDGVWRATADMTTHGTTGMCTVHVWASDSAGNLSPVVATEFYAKTDSGKPYPATSTTVYRLYNPNSGEHFYTLDYNEAMWLKGMGWNYEGSAWTAPLSGNPVYRMYNPNAGDHHYTLNYSEAMYLKSVGWNYEGIGWYSDEKQTTDVYRVYNPNATGAGAHHYTMDYNEAMWLKSLGWNYEGIGWYGL